MSVLTIWHLINASHDIQKAGRRSYRKTDEELLAEFSSTGNLEAAGGALFRLHAPGIRGLPQIS